MLNSCLYVGELLSLVSPHQEHAGLNTPFRAEGNAFPHLFNSNVPLHGIEESLRTALRANPDPETFQIGQCIGYGFIQTICAGDAFKWDSETTILHLLCE